MSVERCQVTDCTDPMEPGEPLGYCTRHRISIPLDDKRELSKVDDDGLKALHWHYYANQVRINLRYAQAHGCHPDDVSDWAHQQVDKIMLIALEMANRSMQKHARKAMAMGGGRR